MANQKSSSKNNVQHESYEFSKRILRIYQYLSQNKREFVLSKEVRSGTLIEANIEEAIGGSSKRDFRAKLKISYMEAREPKYWICVLRVTDYLD